MRRAIDSNEYLSAPAGRYVAGRTWLLWCADPTLCGAVFWGRFEERDVRDLLVPYQIWLHAQMDRVSVLSDARGLEGIDTAAYQRFAAFIEKSFPLFAPRTVRHALVRPGGLVGAVIAGFYDVLGGSTYPVRVFTDSVRALAWLGRSDAAALGAEISALVTAASSEPEALRRLRELLRGNTHLHLVEAARAVGLSERSLQRQLQHMGTSYRAEVDAVRIHTAQTLLADTDEKITAIALEVGCASPQHFSALFRKTTGETPSAWRARQRAVASS